MAAGSTVWVAVRSDGSKLYGTTTVLLVSRTWQDAFDRIMKEVIDERVDAVEDWRLGQESLCGTWPEEVPRPNVPQTRDELQQLLQDPRSVLAPAASVRLRHGTVVEFKPQGAVKFYNSENDLFLLVPTTLPPETDEVPPPQPLRKRLNKSISRC